jgi:formylglycine-generating enzyme required for sulfatase activity
VVRKGGPTKKKGDRMKKRMLLILPLLMFFLIMAVRIRLSQNKPVFDDETVSVDAANPSLPSPGSNACIDDLQLELIWVDQGVFKMGSREGEEDEKPAQLIYISSGYWLGKTEVTQKQWHEVIKNNPSHFQGEDLPVESVSWFDCIEFCKALTMREREAGRLPEDYVYRLPTEAEWEFAAKGGNKSRRYKFAGADKLHKVGWYSMISMDRTRLVGTKEPNELGLHDMNGNVCEWCYDKYGAYSFRIQTDPKGSDSGSDRVYRGGSWKDGGLSYKTEPIIWPEEEYRLGRRSGWLPLRKRNDIGMRVALAPALE